MNSSLQGLVPAYLISIFNFKKCRLQGCIRMSGNIMKTQTFPFLMETLDILSNEFVERIKKKKVGHSSLMSRSSRSSRNLKYTKNSFEVKLSRKKKRKRKKRRRRRKTREFHKISMRASKQKQKQKKVSQKKSKKVSPKKILT